MKHPTECPPDCVCKSKTAEQLQVVDEQGRDTGLVCYFEPRPRPKLRLIKGGKS
jgi:hypothetical protein